MPDWQVSNVRLTVFVTPDTMVPPTLWRDLVGEDPEQSITQRSISTIIETGPFAEGALILQNQPMRIDWMYSAGSGKGPEPGLPNPVGPFPAAAEPILQLVHRWAANAWFPAITRIALGFVLISTTPDLKTGYKELGLLIDGAPNTDDATDFQYQINRPRPSRVLESAQINRLSKWSVGSYQILALNTSTPPKIATLQHHLRLELDINTSPELQGPVPRERFESVIHDLLAGAQEICEQGNRF